MGQFFREDNMFIVLSVKFVAVGVVHHGFKQGM